MGQPRALHLLNFVSMWDCFSYYGMRVLLVLFLVHELGYSDGTAFTLFALYTSLVEMSGIAGGWLADRWLGLRRSILIGGWFIVIGHLCMTIPDSQEAFFTGLGSIIIGTGLFRSNAAMLLGQYYGEDDPRRESGYTLYYAGINIGSLLAILFCGIIAQNYGWHTGFSLASIGMLSGIFALLAGANILEDKGLPPCHAKQSWISAKWLALMIAPIVIAFGLYHHQWFSMIVPWLAIGSFVYALVQLNQLSTDEKKMGWQLLFYIGCLILFYSCEEQLGSSLLLFAERYVDRETWWGTLPASFLLILNPLTIIVTGPLLSGILKKYRIRNSSMIGISFLLVSISFFLLSFASSRASQGENIPLILCFSSFVCIGLGELFIAPVVFSYASMIAPKNHQGTIMGMVAMGFALANLLSGYVSRQMASTETSPLPTVAYQEAFSWISSLALSLGIALLITKLSYIKKLFHRNHFKTSVFSRQNPTTEQS